MYYRGAQAALIVYDITAYDSLRDAKMWVKELREANGADMVIGLIGNKVDLETENKRQVDTREASEYAEENGLIFMETSAKRGDNVTEIFMNVARQVATKQQINTLNKPRGTFSPSKSESQKSSICCNNSTTE
jgi:Ras-related protein Rab-5C